MKKYLIIKTDNKELFDYYKNNKTAHKRTFMADRFNFYIIICHNSETTIINYDSFLKLDNKKLKAVYINFTTSKNCPSHKLGLCPYGNLCYSLTDEKRLKNVYYKHCLNVLFFDSIRDNEEEQQKFITYCNLSHLPIRFNNDGDFRNVEDILFLNKLSSKINQPVGGYTKRTDLITDNILNSINFYLQISNKDYVTTTDLKGYLTHSNKCGGYCNSCLKCYTSYDEKITLLHGSLSKIDKKYNTSENRDYLIEMFKTALNLELTHEQLTTNKGLLNSLNKALKPLDMKFNNYKELTRFLNIWNK